MLINKAVLTGKPVLEYILILLVEAYLKPVLDNSKNISHYKVNLCNVYIKLYRVYIEI